VILANVTLLSVSSVRTFCARNPGAPRISRDLQGSTAVQVERDGFFSVVF
jgi:hypothetical protein